MHRTSEARSTTDWPCRVPARAVPYPVVRRRDAVLEGKGLWDGYREHLPDVARGAVFVTGWADEERSWRSLERAGSAWVSPWTPANWSTWTPDHHATCLEAVNVDRQGERRSYRILLVDDDEALLRPITRHFEQSGHEVYQAVTAEQAVEVYFRVLPHVTLLDLHLPDGSGIEVLQALRRNGAVVVMLTGDGEVSNAVEAMKRGAENFLVKPVELAHLDAVIEKAAEKAILRSRSVELEGQLRRVGKARIRGRIAMVLFVALAVLVGWWVGAGGTKERPAAPIPVPLDAEEGARVPGG